MRQPFRPHDGLSAAASRAHASPMGYMEEAGYGSQALPMYEAPLPSGALLAPSMHSQPMRQSSGRLQAAGAYVSGSVMGQAQHSLMHAPTSGAGGAPPLPFPPASQQPTPFFRAVPRQLAAAGTGADSFTQLHSSGAFREDGGGGGGVGGLMEEPSTGSPLSAPLPPSSQVRARAGQPVRSVLQQYPQPPPPPLPPPGPFSSGEYSGLHPHPLESRGGSWGVGSGSRDSHHFASRGHSSYAALAPVPPDGHFAAAGANLAPLRGHSQPLQPPPPSRPVQPPLPPPLPPGQYPAAATLQQPSFGRYATSQGPPSAESLRYTAPSAAQQWQPQGSLDPMLPKLQQQQQQQHQVQMHMQMLREQYQLQLQQEQEMKAQHARQHQQRLNLQQQQQQRQKQQQQQHLGGAMQPGVGSRLHLQQQPPQPPRERLATAPPMGTVAAAEEHLEWGTRIPQNLYANMANRVPPTNEGPRVLPSSGEHFNPHSYANAEDAPQQTPQPPYMQRTLTMAMAQQQQHFAIHPLKAVQMEAVGMQRDPWSLPGYSLSSGEAISLAGDEAATTHPDLSRAAELGDSGATALARSALPEPAQPTSSLSKWLHTSDALAQLRCRDRDDDASASAEIQRMLSHLSLSRAASVSSDISARVGSFSGDVARLGSFSGDIAARIGSFSGDLPPFTVTSLPETSAAVSSTKDEEASSTRQPVPAPAPHAHEQQKQQQQQPPRALANHVRLARGPPSAGMAAGGSFAPMWARTLASAASVSEARAAASEALAADETPASASEAPEAASEAPVPASVAPAATSKIPDAAGEAPAASSEMPASS